MKLLTLNFLTCARKQCKQSASCFPLHPRDAELEVVETELNPEFIRNILPRVEWEAIRGVAGELGLPTLPESAPSPEALFENEEPSQVLRDLHQLLIETGIKEGKLVCANCEHEYAVREGVANFLLPSHLV